jgi:hypothetical protein
MLMALAVIEIAFFLYARNVVAAAAHEGARAAVELGSDAARAEEVAGRTVRMAAGGLIDRLRVNVSFERSADRAVAEVHVAGLLHAFGPVPLVVPLRTMATTARSSLPL